MWRQVNAITPILRHCFVQDGFQTFSFLIIQSARSRNKDIAQSQTAECEGSRERSGEGEAGSDEFCGSDTL